MKLFVGCAPFEGKVQCLTAASLTREALWGAGQGVAVDVAYLMNAHYIAEAYNILLARFIRGDWDKFCMVEWDVSWSEPGALLSLAKKPYDYVGASTRFKKEPEEYMIGWLPGELWTDEHGCIEVGWIPQGFSVASREMCQRLWDAAQDREYDLRGELVRDIFHDGLLTVGDGFPKVRPGQDTWLCIDWRAMGGKVYVDPEIELTHTASVGHSYTGRLADWLRAIMSPEDRAKAEAYQAQRSARSAA